MEPVMEPKILGFMKCRYVSSAKFFYQTIRTNNFTPILVHNFKGIISKWFSEPTAMKWSSFKYFASCQLSAAMDLSEILFYHIITQSLNSKK